MKKRQHRNLKQRQAFNHAMASGFDVIGAAVAALLLILFLLQLGNVLIWLTQDLNLLFSDLGTNILDAVLVRNRVGF